jgi:hypothetical protein
VNPIAAGLWGLSCAGWSTNEEKWWLGTAHIYDQHFRHVAHQFDEMTIALSDFGSRKLERLPVISSAVNTKRGVNGC